MAIWGGIEYVENEKKMTKGWDGTGIGVVLTMCKLAIIVEGRVLFNERGVSLYWNERVLITENYST